MLKARRLFFAQFLKNIKEIGSITPSSTHLVTKLLTPIDFDNTRTIIELGPGTGCFTTELLKRMHNDATLYAFEINKAFCDKLNNINDDRLHVINASAEHFPDNIPQADVVISGIPYASLPQDTGNRILNAAKTILKPNGLYLQYQYSLVSKNKIKRYFPQLKTGFELRNIPPAFMYICRK